MESLYQLGDAFLDEVVEIIGGHPQALRMFSSLAATYSPRALLAAFATVDTSQVGQLYDAVYAQVWQTLSAEARQLLFAATLVSRQGASEAYLLALMDGDRDALWRAIWQLVGLALLDRRSVGGEIFYYMHHLTERYALHAWRADAAWAARDEVLARGVAYWRAAEVTMAFADAQQPHIRRLLRVAAERPALWMQAADRFSHYFSWIQNSASWRAWIGLLRLLLDQAPAAALRERRRLMSRLGWLLNMDGDYASAASAHQQSLALAFQEEDRQAIAREHLQLCIDYRGLRDYAAAETYGMTSLTLFQEENAGPLYLQHVHNALGLNAYEMREYDGALRHYGEAISYARGLSDWSTAIRILSNIGNCLEHTGDATAAQDAFEEALRLAEEHGGQTDREQVAVSFANLLLKLGETPRATALLDAQGLDGDSPSAILRTRALAALLRGRIARREDNGAAALVQLRRAADLYRRLGDDNHQAIAFLEMRLCFLAQEAHADADAALATAQRLLEASDDPAYAQHVRDEYGL